MDARDLKSKMRYYGMERDARRILLDENLVNAEEIALMTDLDVCEKLLETYEVVSCEDECLTLVKKEDLETYDGIVRYLLR